MSESLKHYGMPRRSGRYPWGSGGNIQRNMSFRGHVQELRKKGLSEVEIAKGEGITTTQLRARISLEKDSERIAKRNEAIRLKDKGYSQSEIGRKMGLNESSVRALLDPVLAARATITKTIASVLKTSVDENRYVDIGQGVELYLGVSPTKLKTAVAELEAQGYKVHTVNVDQIGIPGQFTKVKALGVPDTEWKELVKNPSLIQPVCAYSDDYGRSFNTDLGLKPVQSIDSKRVQVKYADDGGSLKDGVIEVRRGVQDLDLGQSRYAQVRIAVDGTHYMKGMAIYSDDLPSGVDVIYNSNKRSTGNKLDAMKSMTDDPDNPFKSTIKRQHGALNIVNEEGDWDTWSRTISSQVLSKQTVPLAKQQLGKTLDQKKQEYEEISQLTNPVVKRQLLNSFADDCDSSAVHLKAAAMPRQASKVILPIPNMKPNEIYAPSFNNGEKVALIRHPHGGRFEIPELTVNNKSKAARSIMENAVDAVGIHPSVAQKLSGADFDGDSVIVIPNNRGAIKSAPSLKGLQNFDPIESYAIPKGSKIPSINPRVKQTKMGEVSNLITDMTIKGASQNEIARAVRHSMVVIDSEKHNLDYRQSYVDHGIASLSERYQSSKRGGASTLVSRSKSKIYVDERKPRRAAEGGPVDRLTGEKVYTPTGRVIVTREGKIIPRTTKTTRMAEAKDARSLSSGRPVEEVYAGYANALKSMANSARKDALSVKNTPYSPSAKAAYKKEVDSLNSSLNIALKNKPLERQAQILANSIVARKKIASPAMDSDDLKKVRNQALAEARVRTGAKKAQVKISDKEWEAIQAGAISASKLSAIIQNADADRVKRLATPRSKKAVVSTAKLNKAKLLLSTGSTQAEVAEALGLSVKALSEAIAEDRKGL